MAGDVRMATRTVNSPQVQSNTAGAMMANGPLASGAQQQPYLPPASGSTQSSVFHAGSAFTRVSPHHSPQSQTPPGLSSTPPLPGQVPSSYPEHGQSQGSYSGQALQQQSPAAQPSQSTAAAHSLSALHSSKPKRPVMPMTQGVPFTGQHASPSPRSTPPPPSSSPGSAVLQRSTPPPPSNLSDSMVPSGGYNTPPTSFPSVGQDSSPAARSISSRRRVYPAQVNEVVDLWHLVAGEHVNGNTYLFRQV